MIKLLVFIAMERSMNHGAKENWERLYWDDGYSKKLAEDHANYDSPDDDEVWCISLTISSLVLRGLNYHILIIEQCISGQFMLTCS